MEAIDKMRQMVEWFNMQSEYFNLQFKNIKQLEQIYDYAKKKGFEFLDDDYIYAELTEDERVNYYKFLHKKVLKK